MGVADDMPTLIGRVNSVLARLDPRRQLVAGLRTFARTPATLAELSQRFRVSPQRARQLESRVVQGLHTIDPDRIDTPLLRLRIGLTTPLRVADLPALDPLFEGVAEHVDWFRGVLRVLGCRHQLVDDQDGPYVTDRCGADIAALAERCRRELKHRERGLRDLARGQQLLAEILRDFMVPDLQAVVASRLGPLDTAKATAAMSGVDITAASIASARRLWAGVAPAVATPVPEPQVPQAGAAFPAEPWIRSMFDRLREQRAAEARRLKDAVRQAIAILRAAIEQPRGVERPSAP